MVEVTVVVICRGGDGVGHIGLDHMGIEGVADLILIANDVGGIAVTAVANEHIIVANSAAIGGSGRGALVVSEVNDDHAIHRSQGITLDGDSSGVAGNGQLAAGQTVSHAVLDTFACGDDISLAGQVPFTGISLQRHINLNVVALLEADGEGQLVDGVVSRCHIDDDLIAGAGFHHAGIDNDHFPGPPVHTDVQVLLIHCTGIDDGNIVILLGRIHANGQISVFRGGINVVISVIILRSGAGVGAISNGLGSPFRGTNIAREDCRHHCKEHCSDNQNRYNLLHIISSFFQFGIRRCPKHASAMCSPVAHLSGRYVFLPILSLPYQERKYYFRNY